MNSSTNRNTIQRANHSIAISELLFPLQQLEADRYVIDCEMVIAAGEIFSFDGLLQRIDPAASGIRCTAENR